MRVTTEINSAVRLAIEAVLAVGANLVVSHARHAVSLAHIVVVEDASTMRVATVVVVAIAMSVGTVRLVFAVSVGTVRLVFVMAIAVSVGTVRLVSVGTIRLVFAVSVGTVRLVFVMAIGIA